MNSNKRGPLGLELPSIIFGTSCLGNLYRELLWETKLGIVSEWFNAFSIPAIDSAGKYGAGLALESIGKALRELGKKPGDLFISNKLGWRRIPLTTTEPTFEPGAWANLENDAIQDISYDGILRCYREGLGLIGGGFGFDMVSVHDPDEYLNAGGDEDDILEAYQALFELKDAGEVKAVGVGTKDWRVAKQLHKKVKFDWIMLACAPTVLVHPPELITFMKDLEAEGTTIISSAVFNGGFLLG
ncbi:MAG: aldo/keto reductase, partial [Eggerthellaceae bacterium]|nr:aldo/keto reductase [Eggerthellaceae bacterium]